MVVPYSCKYSKGDEETNEGISFAHGEFQRG